MANALTAARVRELLHYDPETGVFVWIAKATPRTKNIVGKIAGSLRRGRVEISIDGSKHQAGRVAWLYMTGKWPEALVDHKDTNAANNRWLNLRDATYMVNAENQTRAKATNVTGFLGVTPHNGRFRADITAKKKRKHLGVFDTPQEAHAVYLQAKRSLHEGCTI